MSDGEAADQLNEEAQKLLRESKAKRLWTLVNSGIFLAALSGLVAVGSWYFKAKKECALQADEVVSTLMAGAKELLGMYVELDSIVIANNDVSNVLARAPGLVTRKSDPTLTKLEGTLASVAAKVDYSAWSGTFDPYTSERLHPNDLIILSFILAPTKPPKISSELLEQIVRKAAVVRFVQTYRIINSHYKSQCNAFQLISREYLGKEIAIVSGAPERPLDEIDRDREIAGFRVRDAHP